MIKTFSDKRAKLIFHGRRSSRLPGNIQQRAFRKLIQLDGAEVLDDLCIPPGNRLETLSGDRARNTVSASTSNGGSVLHGKKEMRMTLKSRTIIDNVASNPRE